MAVWSKVSAASSPACNVRARIPRGFVPMVLVGDAEATEQRVLVHVSMLKEPPMAALLEMAAQHFGYSQQGVLRIPCGESCFRKMVADMECNKPDSS